MAVKILQANLNHTRAAQDLVMQRVLEDKVGILLISELTGHSISP